MKNKLILKIREYIFPSII